MTEQPLPQKRRVEWNPTADTWLAATAYGEWSDVYGRTLVPIWLEENGQYLIVEGRHLREVAA